MKIRNKIIALIISLIAIPTFALAKDGPYVGVKAANININYEKIDGVDIGLILPSEFNAWDFNIGYNLGNSFFELGYIKSNTENKNIASGSFTSTSGGATTYSLNSSLKFDGYRVGAGHNFPISKEFNIKPFINYYEIDMTVGGSLTINSGGTTVTLSGSAPANDSMIDAGLGLDYIINDKSKISLSYAQTLDSLGSTDKVETWALAFNYQF